MRFGLTPCRWSVKQITRGCTGSLCSAEEGRVYRLVGAQPHYTIAMVYCLYALSGGQSKLICTRNILVVVKLHSLICGCVVTKILGSLSEKQVGFAIAITQIYKTRTSSTMLFQSSFSVVAMSCSMARAYSLHLKKKLELLKVIFCNMRAFIHL